MQMPCCCARFESGAQSGHTPQLAPDHVIRAGLIYARGESAKVSLLGTFVYRAFGDDNNSGERILPRYAVWDLTTELKIPRTRIRLVAGINNVFDEDYYNRVANSGIDPPPRRNYYTSIAINF
jgi:Fe(3+) dicitrate transport protein